MSNVVEYSSKSTAARGFGRAYGDKLNADKFVVKFESGKWGFDKDAADAALGVADVSEGDKELILDYGYAHCPACGVHLSNGVGDFDGMVDRHGPVKAYSLQKKEWACLGCGHEFGNDIPAPKGRKAPTGRTYSDKSVITGAVAYCHELFTQLTTENPDIRRKDAIQAAVDMGVAFFTARTQYQKWHKANKAK